MTNLRKLAKDQTCTVRIPGICNGNRETVVLAHIRKGFFGAGIKPPDICGVWACSSCHDAMDGRRKAPALLTDDILRALLEQLRIYVDKGILKW